MRKTIFIGLLVVLLAILVTLVYVYNKPHRDVADEPPAYSLTLEEIYNEFQADEMAASDKYFNKVVEVEGTVTSLQEKEGGRFGFVLEASGKVANGEIVALESGKSDLVGKRIKIKGLFVGYDNLLEEIQFSECTIVKFL